MMMCHLIFKLKLLFTLSMAVLFYSPLVMAIEEPAYEVIEADDDFELRLYEPMIVAEVFVSGTRSEASNKGFRLIADYIFGNNRTSSGDSQKVAMTAPVTIQIIGNSGFSEKQVRLESLSTDSSDDQRWRVHFVMPNEYSMRSLPKPNNTLVSLREVKKLHYASIRFSGFTGEQKVAAKTRALYDWIIEKNLIAKGEPELARYNPPWTLPFARRNEILIEIEPD